MPAQPPAKPAAAVLRFCASCAATLACWALVPAISRIGGVAEPLPPTTEEEAG